MFKNSRKRSWVKAVAGRRKQQVRKILQLSHTGENMYIHIYTHRNDSVVNEVQCRFEDSCSAGPNANANWLIWRRLLTN